MSLFDWMFGIDGDDEYYGDDDRPHPPEDSEHPHDCFCDYCYGEEITASADRCLYDSDWRGAERAEEHRSIYPDYADGPAVDAMNGGDDVICEGSFEQGTEEDDF